MKSWKRPHSSPRRSRRHSYNDKITPAVSKAFEKIGIHVVRVHEAGDIYHDPYNPDPNVWTVRRPTMNELANDGVVHYLDLDEKPDFIQHYFIKRGYKFLGGGLTTVQIEGPNPA